MGRRAVTQLANQIKRVLSSTVINDVGRPVGFLTDPEPSR